MKEWTTKSGSKLKICDMTDNHLLNSIRYLDRLFEEIKSEHPYPSFRGGMAQYYADQQYEALQNSSVGDIFPIYNDLMEEAIERGLYTDLIHI